MAGGASSDYGDDDRDIFMRQNCPSSFQSPGRGTTQLWKMSRTRRHFFSVLENGTRCQNKWGVVLILGRDR